MEFISANEAAAKWGISQKNVVLLCLENRISNAKISNNIWMIPVNAENPLAEKNIKNNTIKPFLKWAGGKGQILKEIEKYYPFKNGAITKYAEP